MPSSFVCVDDARFLLSHIEGMTQTQRHRTFASATSRYIIVRAFVRRKLEALKKGVTWERTTAPRVRRGEFLAVKKREMRLLQGECDVAKKTKIRHSYMIRHKLAVHMVLTEKPIPRWDRVPCWAAKRDNGHITRTDVAELMQEAAGRGLGLRERRLLSGEIQSAGRCSHCLLFGKDAS